MNHEKTKLQFILEWIKVNYLIIILIMLWQIGIKFVLGSYMFDCEPIILVNELKM